jgi:hypothetical protein
MRIGVCPLNDDKRCHCGRFLHYSDPEAERDVQAIVDRLGETIVITIGQRSWRVPRHYVALHGVKAQELPDLGFEEIQLCPNGTHSLKNRSAC